MKQLWVRSIDASFPATGDIFNDAEVLTVISALSGVAVGNPITVGFAVEIELNPFKSKTLYEIGVAVPEKIGSALN
jgi:hypothetical protein